MVNIFIITSKIIVSNNKLSYINHRSIYSAAERFNDTIVTINSIKKVYPQSIIILVDNSQLDQAETTYLHNNVSCFLDRKYINSIQNIDYITDISPCKGTAEMTQLSIALHFIKYKNIIADNIFKISGRYKLVNFDKKPFLDEKFVFKKNEIVTAKGLSNKYYYTCFYKFPYKFLDLMINIASKFTNVRRGGSIILDGKYLGLEEVLPIFILDKIDASLFKIVDKLGVEQKISVVREKDYENLCTAKFI